MTRVVFVAVVLWASAASAASPQLHRLAAWLALAVSPAVPAPPAPEPKPAPGGEICPECNGRGKRGDGTIDFICENCGGTGRVQTAPPAAPAPAPAAKAAPLTSTVNGAPAPVPAASTAPLTNSVKVERYAIPPRDGRTYRKVCRDGVCAWEPVQ
jgi:hypothetical protein